MEQPNILISVLDWGLGHATRCIPIIKTLQNQGANITVACTPKLKNIFKKELENVDYLSLPGYNISYSRHQNLLFFSLLKQLPHLLAVINKERKWLQKICLERKFDAIISDNRFGFYHKKIPSVYITHQLFIETGNSFLNSWAQKIHYRFINKFAECWVPDVKEMPGLAGALSHPKKLPQIPVHYLGIYSRFTKVELPKNIDYLFILSGPEPQRTIFEEIILKQLPEFPVAKMVLVRGLPLAEEIVSTQKNLKIYNHVAAAELSELIQSSNQIICRSGYTSLLDLVSLKKFAHLIPTPGQTEQIYLAKHMAGKNGFSFIWQENFSLATISKLTDIKLVNEIKAESKIEEVIKDFLFRLKG